MMPLLFTLYDGLLTLLSPILWLLNKNAKNPRVRLERFGTPTRKRPSGDLIWIHGASLGEVKALEPLLIELSTLPETTLLITSSSRRSLAGITQFINNRWLHQFLPYDTPKYRQAFLSHWKPSAVFWTESDFWPGYFKALHEKKIPLTLINGKLSQASYHKWCYAAPVFRQFFSYFTALYLQSEKDQARFENLGVSNTHALGNFKFLQPISPTPSKESAAFKKRFTRPHLWLAASTHPGEDPITVAVHKTLSEKRGGTTTLLAPRHPKRIPALQKYLKDQGFQVACHSEHKKSTAPLSCDFYLIDTFGELSFFYALVPFCFLGGTFVSAGGHSPIEALKNHCGPYVGPNIHSNETLYTPFIEAGLISICATEDQLKHKILKAAHSSETQNTSAEKIEHLLKNEEEKVKTLIQTLKKGLKTPQKGLKTIKKGGKNA